ncbi:hypothetical protein BGX34_005827, partial [Mortierella sp. NVP85]
MDDCKGYSSNSPPGTPQVVDLAFVDDTSWISSSRRAMQEMLDVATSFFELNNVEINAKETQVIARYNRNGGNTYLESGTSKERIDPVPKNETVRILGVWVTTDGKMGATQALVENDVDTICNIIGKKAVTDRMATYIINGVLIPKVLYKTLIQTVARSFVRKMMGRYMKLNGYHRTLRMGWDRPSSKNILYRDQVIQRLPAQLTSWNQFRRQYKEKKKESPEWFHNLHDICHGSDYTNNIFEAWQRAKMTILDNTNDGPQEDNYLSDVEGITEDEGEAVTTVVEATAASIQEEWRHIIPIAPVAQQITERQPPGRRIPAPVPPWPTRIETEQQGAARKNKYVSGKMEGLA